MRSWLAIGVRFDASRSQRTVAVLLFRLRTKAPWGYGYLHVRTASSRAQWSDRATSAARARALQNQAARALAANQKE
jgi:hypothetical protein